MPFSLDKASFGMRVLAEVIDVLLIYIPIGVFIPFFFGIHNGPYQDILTSVFYMIYCILLPVAWQGYDVGRRMMSIKVKKENGNKLNLLDMVFRELLGKYLLGVITGGLSIIISALMVVFRKDKKAVHDMIAGTYVSNEG